MLLRGFRHAVPYIIGYVEERSWRTNHLGRSSRIVHEFSIRGSGIELFSRNRDLEAALIRNEANCESQGELWRGICIRVN